ncbi:hypothetical protein [Roseovarius tolerans]|nr:hypothetical protein [Roseovarius tolerans]
MNTRESERRRMVGMRCADVGNPVEAVAAPLVRESVSGNIA